MFETRESTVYENHAGTQVDLSTLSQVNKTRDPQINVQQKVDDYLATKIPEEVMSHEVIGEAYRQRWAIEVLWKFLKTHLKLDKMMSKNLHGITVQIYVVLIVYYSLFDIATIKNSTDVWK